MRDSYINPVVKVEEGITPIGTEKDGDILFLELTPTHFILRDHSGQIIIHIARYLIPLVRKLQEGSFDL